MSTSLPPLVEPARRLSREEVARYSRHLIIPELGVDGQRRLKNARVLVIGAGGLGAPALLYLAAAGIGTIGIVDFDVVDESNLQRQIIHGVADVGRYKAQSARDSILAINPLVEVVLHEFRLDAGNAVDLFGRYDLILDGTDNCWRESRTSGGRSTDSRARFRCSGKTHPTGAGSTTGTSTPSRRHPGRCRPAPKAECSASSAPPSRP